MSLSQNQSELLGKVLSLINSSSNESIEDECRNVVSFSHLLETFVHLDFTEEEAEEHWKKILLCSAELEKKLSKPVTAHLAIVDYFTSRDHRLTSPMLIEIHVFRQTEKLAMIDCLTNVFNRRYMDIVLKKEFNRCERYNKSFSICILDLDNFKHINDSKGHQFGDTVLVELTNLIKNTIREEDVLCRYGGEEFCLILPDTVRSGARDIAERVRHCVEEMAQPHPLSPHGIVTVSLGTATLSPGAADNPSSLLSMADRALYLAKSEGRNCVRQASLPNR